MLADPKALQHVFRGYNYPKRADFRQTIRLLTGTGLLYVDGTQPTRHLIANFRDRLMRLPRSGPPPTEEGY